MERELQVNWEKNHNRDTYDAGHVKRQKPVLCLLLLFAFC